MVHVGATEGGRMTARPPASILGSLHVCEADGCECERKEGLFAGRPAQSDSASADRRWKWDGRRTYDARAAHARSDAAAHMHALSSSREKGRET